MMEGNKLQSAECERAFFVLSEFKGFKKAERKNSEILSYFAGLPALVMTNGLGQSLAFIIYKGTKDSMQEFTAKTIIKWLTEKHYLEKAENNDDIFSQLSSMEQEEYIMAQTEVLLLMDSMKIYSRVIFQDKENDQEDE